MLPRGSMWAVCLTLSACGIGSGTGSVSGAVYIRECAEHEVGSEDGKVYSFGTPTDPQAYDMHPTFFAAEPVNDFQRLDPVNRLNVRVQSDGSRVEEADVLFVNVGDDFDAASMVGQPITVGPTTNVRASLNLNQSCPDPEVTPTLQGTITFSAFGSAVASHVPVNFNINLNDRLTATFDFSLVDVRAATLGGEGSVPTAPAVGGTLTGFFDFVVQQGQSLQAFP